MFEEEVAAIGEEAPQDPPSFVRPCHPNFQLEEVAAIGEEAPQDPPSFVRSCHPNFQVGNWRVMSQSEVYTVDSM